MRLRRDAVQNARGEQGGAAVAACRDAAPEAARAAHSLCRLLLLLPPAPAPHLQGVLLKAQRHVVGSQVDLHGVQRRRR